MKAKSALVLFAITFFIGACNKNTTFTGAKIYVMHDMKNGNSLTFTYNTDGSVATIQSSAAGKTTVQYSSGIALVDIYSNAGIINQAVNYFLNSSSCADSGQGQYLLQNHSWSYSFDGNQQVTETRAYVGGVLDSIYDYTNVNKNVTERNITLVTQGNKHFYDYYTFLSSNANTIGTQDQGLYYLGIQSSNLVNTDIKINNNLDTVDIISYRYIYDTNSNVDTMTTHNRVGQLQDSIAFTYY